MRHTNDLIDNYILNNFKTIKRLEDITHSRKKILWECLQCFHQWKTTSASILQNTECPQCNNHVKLTNKIIDDYLINNNIPIKRIGEVSGTHSKIEWKCINCNLIWKTSPGAIKNNNTECKLCYFNNKKINNDKLSDIILKNNIPIKILSNVNGIKSKITLQCQINTCNYIWETIARSIVIGYGCPKCAGNAKLTNEIIDNFLISNNLFIKRISDVCGTDNKILWQCLNCKFEWTNSPNRIKNYGDECPQCKEKYFSTNENIIREFLKENNIEHESQYKIITNADFSKSKWIKVDFYLSAFNSIIEYNGAQHYSPIIFGNYDIQIAEAAFKKQQERDQFLRNYCKLFNINLLEIDGRKYKNNKLKILLNKTFNKETI